MVMSDSEDTAQLLGLPNIQHSSLTNKNNESKKSPGKMENNLFMYNRQKHIFETFSSAQHYLAAMVSILTGLCFGFDMTIGTNIILSLGSILDLNCFEHRMLVNGWIAGAFVGSMFGGVMIDKIGRRSVMLGSSLIFSTCSFLGITSGTYLIPFIPRFLSGCAVCSLVMSHCVYVTEKSTNNGRDRIVVSQQIGLQIGILLSAVVGFQNATNQNNQSFHIITGLTCAFGIIIFSVAYIFFPESHYFILSKDKGTNLSEQYYGTKNSIRTKSVAWPFAFIFTITFLVQLTARPWVLYYAPRIFAVIGICTSIIDSTAALAMAATRILSSLFLLYSVIYHGIKGSMILSFVIMGISLNILGISILDDISREAAVTSGSRVCNVLPVYSSIGMLSLPCKTELKFSDVIVFEKGDATPPPFPLLPTPVALRSKVEYNPLNCPLDELLTDSQISPIKKMSSLVSLLTYELSYAIGFGSLSWLLASQVFPSKWRGTGLGATLGLQFVIDLFIQMKIFPTNVPVSIVYGCSGFICIGLALACQKLMPVTKCKSLSEIQTVMNDRYISCWTCWNECHCVDESQENSESTHI